VPGPLDLKRSSSSWVSAWKLVTCRTHGKQLGLQSQQHDSRTRLARPWRAIPCFGLRSPLEACSSVA
jgi:hypothetical protein